MKNTEIAKYFGISSATVGNYKKSEGKKRHIYDALLSFARSKSLPDPEYWIERRESHVVYHTIREREPLFIMFEKSSFSIVGMSPELEDDADAILNIIKS